MLPKIKHNTKTKADINAASGKISTQRNHAKLTRDKCTRERQPDEIGQRERNLSRPQLHQKVVLREEVNEGAFKRVKKGTKLLQFLLDNPGPESNEYTSHVCLTGKDGSGRSTVLDGFIYDLIRNETNLFASIEIIITLKCGNYEEKCRENGTNLVFSDIASETFYCIGQVDGQRHSSYCSNPKLIEIYAPRICFVLDDIDRVIVGHANEQDRVTLTRILSGDMYSGCTVVSSCHEETFDSVFKKSNNTRKLYTSGLTEDVVKEIARSSLPHEAYNNNFLKMTSYTLALCENPLIMYCTIFGIKYQETSIPIGASGIFLNGLNRIFNNDNNPTINLRKFVAACYNIKKTGKATLKTSDLDKVGLTRIDVSILSLDTIFFTKTIKSGEESEIAFCHPIILDGFVALHLYNHDKLTSRDEYEKVIGDEKFIGACNMLTGFVVHKQNTESVINMLSSGEFRLDTFFDMFLKHFLIIFRRIRLANLP